MRTNPEINGLLAKLETQTADSLEDQDLDFKEWISRSMSDSVNLVVETAICMSNGGGGDTIWGVKDKVIGRKKAILGVPQNVDISKLQQAVYDRTDPKIIPKFREIDVPEGTGRLVIVSVVGARPYCTDTAGTGKIRVGKDCVPLTGSMRNHAVDVAGSADVTLEPVPGSPESHVSSIAMERLREIARLERVPDDLINLSNVDLLASVGAIRGGRLTHGGLLLAGKDSSIREHLPHFVVTHLRMRTEIAYTDQSQGNEAIAVALNRLYDRIMTDNPITTIQLELFHLEYRTYPELALREALANAFCHADYRIASPVLVKQYPSKLEISNPGAFIGGITAENILHHPPTARNPHLVDAMTRLRLVNRANLGISRMYQALLIEGKEPPLFEMKGAAVVVTFLRSEFSSSFRNWVAEQERAGNDLSVDALLIIQYLLRHPEIEPATAARICQRSEEEAREILSAHSQRHGYLDRGGTGRGTYYVLDHELYRQLAGPGDPDKFGRIEWEAAKVRILSVLKQRATRGQPGLTNAEVRNMTRYDRQQAKRLLSQLQAEKQIRLAGRGRYATWEYRERGR
jgi:ATP-dependent DNA helicase RecG